MAGKEKSKAKTGKRDKGHTPLVELAYQQIRRMLLVRDLVPNQKLRYQDIARKLGVSQTPVILALTKLENEGLVRSETNKGFYIPELDLDEARELYQMRSIIESFLVREVAGRITDQELASLAEIMKEHHSYRRERYTLERLWCDARFHVTLASFSGNQVGERFLRQVFDRLYLRYRPERLTVSRMLEAEQEHELVFAALKEHDASKAARVLGGHIQRGSDHIVGGLLEEVKSKEAVIPWD